MDTYPFNFQKIEKKSKRRQSLYSCSVFVFMKEVERIYMTVIFWRCFARQSIFCCISDKYCYTFPNLIDRRWVICYILSTICNKKI